MVEKKKTENGWVVVDGVHCCYCQLGQMEDTACPKHDEVEEPEPSPVYFQKLIDLMDKAAKG
jgi:hypothetical protein